MTDDALLDRIGRLEAGDAMRNLMSSYCRAIDSRSRPALEQVFAPDAVLRRGSLVVGRDAILDFYQAFLDMETTLCRHHLTNLEVVVESPTRARARAYYVATIGVNGTSYVSFGGYDDVGERRGDRWVVVEKTIENVTATPLESGWARPATPGAPWRNE